MSVTPRKHARVLVVGASGQIGRAMCSAFEQDYTVVGTGHQHIEGGHRRLDLGDTAAVVKLCQDVRPDIVLLAGAMSNVDACELQPDVCFRINLSGTQAVNDYIRANGGFVILISTDHVFDGSLPSHSEADPTAPGNVYSSSKAKAEDVLRRDLPDRHLILRTSWVYGFDIYRRNFVLRLIDRLRRGESVRVPEDQWGSPTFAEDVARAARSLLQRGCVGTFHAIGADFVSRTTLADRVCKVFDLDPSLVIPCSTQTLGQAAPRALKVRLSSAKMRDAGIEPFCGVDAGLDALRSWQESLLVNP